jgi:predicted double-glycine peptidase
VQTSEREMALLAGTVPLIGTSEVGMVRALQMKGLPAHAEYHVDWEDLLQAPRPLITIIRIPGTTHAVVLLEAREEGVLLGDPLRGEEAYSKEAFLEVWVPAIVVLDR